MDGGHTLFKQHICLDGGQKLRWNHEYILTRELNPVVQSFNKRGLPGSLDNWVDISGDWQIHNKLYVLGVLRMRSFEPGGRQMTHFPADTEQDALSFVCFHKVLACRYTRNLQNPQRKPKKHKHHTNKPTKPRCLEESPFGGTLSVGWASICGGMGRCLRSQRRISQGYRHRTSSLPLVLQLLSGFHFFFGFGGSPEKVVNPQKGVLVIGRVNEQLGFTRAMRQDNDFEQVPSERNAGSCAVA